MGTDRALTETEMDQIREAVKLPRGYEFTKVDLNFGSCLEIRETGNTVPVGRIYRDKSGQPTYYDGMGDPHVGHCVSTHLEVKHPDIPGTPDLYER